MNSKRQKTILLVEDNTNFFMSESRKLKNYGYTVVRVINCQKAIEALRENKTVIDLILLDINLCEEIDGTGILQIILKEYDIPLLILTNNSEREDNEKTENINFYGYVVKDSGITVLDTSIKMAFKLHEAYQRLIKQNKLLESKKKQLQVFEKRYRRLFESAKDGILILNADDGMIVDVNPFLIEMLGYSKEQFLKKNIWDISAFKNIDYSKQLYKELQDKNYVRYDDLPLETYEGNLIHVEFVSNVYLVDNERVIQCNIRDITERKKHEKILIDDIYEKEALLKELQHRTKNSFNIITSLINLRSSVTQSEETKNTLEELTLRVKSISDLYSLLYGTDSFYEVQLKTYCSKVIESMLNLSKNIVINKNIEEVSVSSKNAATIGMIIVELLSNAIKYAFPGYDEGIINIELKKENTQIVLIVEDNGIGLPDNFDITQIKSLGLDLVNLMVRQLDGKIKFISGIGTLIETKFPMDKMVYLKNFKSSLEFRNLRN